MPISGLTLLLCLALPVEHLFAQRTLTIKLASLVPENTPWGTALNRMASEWATISHGEVELVVYHGGVRGEENAVLQQLKSNAIQAGVFTSVGLNQISSDMMTLSTPLLIRNDRELDAVLAELKPVLERHINEQRFFMLTWAKAGWVKVFSKTQVFTPTELKRLKIGTPPDLPNINRAFIGMNYRLENMTFGDTLMALNSGKVDAIYNSPIYVASLQVFTIAKYMMSINVAPVMGGIVMNQQREYQALTRLPYWPQLLAATQKIGLEINASIGTLEATAMNTMLSYGLKLSTLTLEQENLWYADMEKAMPDLLRVGAFNRELYDQIFAILQRYRNSRNKL
jgi:TRAP-type C4-dicarboxylate transport system substrate-binding protein